MTAEPVYGAVRPNLLDPEETTAFHLASLADVAEPDSLDSDGALFLLGVREAVVEALEERQEAGDTSPMTEAEILVAADHVAGEAAPTGTWAAWRVFVDLGAWQEDEAAHELAALGPASERCRWPIYSIAYRLASILLRFAASTPSEPGRIY